MSELRLKKIEYGISYSFREGSVQDAVRAWILLPDDSLEPIYLPAQFDEDYAGLRARVMAKAEEEFGG